MSECAPKWFCDYCTYENWPSAVRCTMCSMPHQSLNIISAPETLGSPCEAESHWWGKAGGGVRSTPLICPDSSVRTVDTAPETPAGKWACATCTYQNLARALRCTACLLPKGTRSPAEPQGCAAWATSQPQPTSPGHADELINNDRNRLNARYSKWTCSICTYDNWPKSLKCSVCGHSRPNYFDVPEGPEVWAGERTASDGTPVVAPISTTRTSPCVGRRDLGSTSGCPRIEVAGAVGNEREVDAKRLKQIKNRLRKTDWLFLNACIGVVEGDFAAVEAYKTAGGDIARQLSADEAQLLSRPSAFDQRHTLVHLAIRFQQQDILAMLLTEVSQHVVKCIPAFVCPELTELIRREVAASLQQRKGDFPCYFMAEFVTFTLPAEIEDLPPAVQVKLYDELLDRDVQKELEEESPIINWSLELCERLDSRLYALWNRTAGDCLLDSVLQATWGIDDKDCVLRGALRDSLHDCSHWFFTRWKDWESWYSQSFGLRFSLREDQWQEDWSFILSLASQPGASLEHTHIFVLAHILRRPIIVYGVKFYKSFRGETLGYARFQGVYLPLLWEPGFCCKSPIALGYTRGHFSALVPLENDGLGSLGAGANTATDEDDEGPTAFLPLVDSDRKLLPVHFLSTRELGSEEQHERLLRDWLDCCVTEGGLLVARQILPRHRQPLIAQMLDRWLDTYRRMAHRAPTTLSDGEDDDDDDE
uniref:ubiquitinyl hydrolase 1 n=1 Tax=Eptatretus burgeri TaxID=7764 RepID=A0A8C4PY54_EPTBU